MAATTDSAYNMIFLVNLNKNTINLLKVLLLLYFQEEI